MLRFARSAALITAVGVAALFGAACASDDEEPSEATTEATAAATQAATEAATAEATATLTATATATEAAGTPTATATSDATPGAEASEDDLVGITWNWTGTLMGDGTEFEPNEPGDTTVTFNADGSVSVQTDCNVNLGTYTLDAAESTISIELTATTLIECPPESTQEQFLESLQNVTVWSIAEDGTLLLDMPASSGTLSFTQ